MMEIMIDLETVVLLDAILCLSLKRRKKMLSHVNTTIFQRTRVKTTYMKEGQISCVKYGHS